MRRMLADAGKCIRNYFSVQMMAGFLLVAVSLAGTGMCRYLEKKQIRKFRNLAGIGCMETSNTETPEDVWKGDGSEAFFYDWNALAGQNSDIKGWLRIPDTPVNFPVAGASDNSYYLTHDFWKEKNRLGCPFMDKDTRKDDFNRTIYAHNVGGNPDAMFSPLLQYKDETYFMEHRMLYYTDCYETVTAYQVTAVVEYDIKDTGSWDFRTRNHPDMESRDIWMERLQERALYYARPSYAPEKILTFSTCDRSEHGKDGRLVIVAEKYPQE